MIYAMVFIGGGVGAVVRYVLTTLGNSTALQTGISPFFGGAFPLATLAINIAGSFFIGLLCGYADSSAWFQQWGRALLVSGVLGGFTTYSAFALETTTLLAQQRAGVALVYVVLTVSGCIAAAWIGQRLVV